MRTTSKATAHGAAQMYPIGVSPSRTGWHMGSCWAGGRSTGSADEVHECRVGLALRLAIEDSTDLSLALELDLDGPKPKLLSSVSSTGDLGGPQSWYSYRFCFLISP